MCSLRLQFRCKIQVHTRGLIPKQVPATSPLVYAEPIRFVDFCHWPPELTWDVLVIKLDDYATNKSNCIRPMNSSKTLYPSC